MMVKLAGDLDDEVSAIAFSTMELRNSMLSPGTVFHSFSDVRDSLLPIILQLKRRPLDNVVTLFKRWCKAFDRFYFAHYEILHSPADMKTYALLQLYRRYLDLEIAAASTCDNENPLIWDQYRETFREMIDFVEHIRYSPDDLVNPKPQFNLEIGTVPILYSIILKCRDQSIRGRAMSVLQSQKLQEGVWDSNTVCSIAQRVIALEGDGLAPIGVPNHARVRQVLAKIGRSQEEFEIYYQLSNGWRKEIVST